MSEVLSISEFCRAYGISRGTFYNLQNDGRGPVVTKIGRRRLIHRQHAQAWFEAQDKAA